MLCQVSLPETITVPWRESVLKGHVAGSVPHSAVTGGQRSDAVAPGGPDLGEVQRSPGPAVAEHVISRPGHASVPAQGRGNEFRPRPGTVTGGSESLQ
jgi:hypothetical protein